MVRHEALGWAEAEVCDCASDGRHWLHVQGWGADVLHPWNHAPMCMPPDHLEEWLTYHMELLKHSYGCVEEPLTGKRLDIIQECIQVSIAEANEESGGAARGGGRDAPLSSPTPADPNYIRSDSHRMASS